MENVKPGEAVAGGDIMVVGVGVILEVAEDQVIVMKQFALRRSIQLPKPVATVSLQYFIQ